MNFDTNFPAPLMFPVDALPEHLFNVANELQRNTKAPWELIVTSMLGAISVACQGAVNVQVPNNISAPIPVSLYFTALIKSGGGKTTLDKLVAKPLAEFEVRQSDFLKQQRTKYKADMIAWNIKKKAIEKAIEKASKIDEADDQLTAAIPEAATVVKTTPETTELLSVGIDFISMDASIAQVPDEQSVISTLIDQLKGQLTEHLANEPARPRNVKIMYNNSSPAALLRSLHENWSSASLASDEAGGIFNGQAMNDLAMLNKLWEGGTVHVERIDSESFVLRNARLTLALMVQPKVFQKYLERRGDEARAIGLFARCFICCPISSVGTRYLGHVAPVWQHLSKFHARITELLEQNLAELTDPEFTRQTLYFSPDAKQLWINAFNEVESYLYPGQYFADIADYGAKFGENLARLAALFHYFDGQTGEISYETTNRAFAVCKWFMSEFKRIFSSDSELPVEVSDANELENWLGNLCRRYPGWNEIGKNVIAQLGPNQLRKSKIRRDAALYVLACSNKIRIVQRGKTKLVQLNPQFFPIPQIPYPVQYQQIKGTHMQH